MGEAVARALGEVCSSVVSVGTLPLADLPRIEDRRAGHGPLAGIEALLASNLDTQYLICPNDIPRVTPDLLRLLIEETSNDATIFERDDVAEVQSLPIRIAASTLPVVQAALDDGVRAVHRFLEEIDVRVVRLTNQMGRRLFNVNTPPDYEQVSDD